MPLFGQDLRDDRSSAAILTSPGFLSTTTSPQLSIQGYAPLSQRSLCGIILQSPQSATSVAEFMASARALAITLPDRPYVLNLHRNRHDYLRAFCATVIAGQCTLMPPDRQEKTLAELAERFPGCYRLGENDSPLAATKPAPVGDAGQGIPEIPLQQLCAIAFTSGSTGTPSPNFKTWHTLHSSTRANCAALLQGWSGSASLLATVPAQHMWGMETSILMPLFADLAISASHPLYPQDIATDLQALPAPRMLVSSPLHLQALMKSAVSLPELVRVFTATAPLSQSQAKEFEAYFSCPLIDVFGSSETGTIAVRQTASQTLWNVSAPFHLDQVEQKTRVSAEHLPAPAFLADQVELVGKQQFRWVARDNDLVNVGGKRASLADLNRRLLAIEGIVDSIIFKPAEGTERLAALIVAPGLSSKQIRQVLQGEIDPVFLPRPMIFLSVLPRNETGKLPLAKVRELYNIWRQNVSRRAEQQ